MSQVTHSTNSFSDYEKCFAMQQLVFDHGKILIIVGFKDHIVENKKGAADNNENKRLSMFISLPSRLLLIQYLDLFEYCNKYQFEF